MCNTCLRLRYFQALLLLFKCFALWIEDFKIAKCHVSFTSSSYSCFQMMRVVT